MRMTISPAAGSVPRISDQSMRVSGQAAGATAVWQREIGVNKKEEGNAVDVANHI